MKPSTTIDRLDLKDHVRWARDQNDYDVSLIREAAIVAHHPEILGTSVIYPSKFEELFELQKNNQHWAAFEPPQNFHQFSRRFFSYRLFPNLDWDEDEELKQKVLELQNPDALSEKDKTVILNLFDSIEWIDRLLGKIHSFKTAMSKG